MPRQNTELMRKTCFNFVEQIVENFTSGNFSRFLFNKSFNNLKVLSLGKFLKLIQLRFERKNLTVFLISTFTNIDVIFYRGFHGEGIKLVSKNRFSKNWNLIYLNNPL